MQYFTVDPSTNKFDYGDFSDSEYIYVILDSEEELVDVQPHSELVLHSMNLEYIQSLYPNRVFVADRLSIKSWDYLKVYVHQAFSPYRKDLFTRVKYWNDDLKEYTYGWAYEVLMDIQEHDEALEK